MRASTSVRLLTASALAAGALALSAGPASAAITGLSIAASPDPGVVNQPLTVTMTCTFTDPGAVINSVGYISFGSPTFFLDGTESGPTINGDSVTYTYSRTFTPTTVATGVEIAGECDAGSGPLTQDVFGTVDIVASAPVTTTTTAPASTTTTTTTTTGTASTSTTAAAVAGTELARSGAEVAPFAILGGASALTGLGLLRARRRRS
jgi:hypothetical protein